MKTHNTCPCPNLSCPNHNDCSNCTSRHLRIGSLNYCAFYSFLNKMEEAIKASHDSPTSLIIKNQIDKQTKHYARCMKKYGISIKQSGELRIKKSKQSNH